MTLSLSVIFLYYLRKSRILEVGNERAEKKKP